MSRLNLISKFVTNPRMWIYHKYCSSLSWWTWVGNGSVWNRVHRGLVQGMPCLLWQITKRVSPFSSWDRIRLTYLCRLTTVWLQQVEIEAMNPGPACWCQSSLYVLWCKVLAMWIELAEEVEGEKHRVPSCRVRSETLK